jgi:hypothetical protein
VPGNRDDCAPREFTCAEGIGWAIGLDRLVLALADKADGDRR